MISAPPTAQNNVAGVFCVDVRRGQVDGAATRMGHLRLRPTMERPKRGGETGNQRKVLVHDGEKKTRERKK